MVGILLCCDDVAVAEPLKVLGVAAVYGFRFAPGSGLSRWAIHGSTVGKRYLL